MRLSPKSLVRRPNGCSAAEPDGPTAAGSGGLDKNDSDAPPTIRKSGPKLHQRRRTAQASCPIVSRLLPTLSLGDLRLEWRRLFRAEPPRLSRDIMMRAVAYRLQEIAHGGLPKRRSAD